MIRDDSQQVSGSDQQASLSGLPDFLTENEAVRNQLVQWQVDWMKNYDIDYFRVDTVKHVDSTTWSAFKNELTKANPAFKMIGEYYGAGHSWNGGALGSGQMDSVLDLASYHTIKDIPDDKSILQDRLFYREVYYIATIPENFEEKCLKNKETLPVTKIP